MQRVLSFPNRGFGETSEFVTKRTCCSFLISIAFFCLLCGFIIGRFAVGRLEDLRIERLKLDLIGNGLITIDHYRNDIIQGLKVHQFDSSFHISDKKVLETVETTLSGLNIFDKVTGNDSCVIASVRGSKEPDRSIALAVDGENIVIALAIAKEYQKIYEYEWIPRRSLIFLFSTDSKYSCLNSLSHYERLKIIAYIAIDKTPVKGDGLFTTSGSDMVQSTVLEATKEFSNFKQSFNPRLMLPIPHSIISFQASINNSLIISKNYTQIHRSTVAQVISNSLWRLSEMIIYQWNPDILNEVSSFLYELESPEELKERIDVTLKRIVENGRGLVEKISEIDQLKSLKVRMMNDFLKDLEMALLCPDSKNQSKTDVTIIKNNSKNLNNYLTDMLKCFEDADKMLQDMKT